MAALTGTSVQRQWTNDASDKASLYAIKGMSAGDTVDFGPSGLGEFKTIKFAVIIGTTFAGSATDSVAGSVVTIPAGPSNDAGYMLVWGVSM